MHGVAGWERTGFINLEKLIEHCYLITKTNYLWTPASLPTGPHHVGYHLPPEGAVLAVDRTTGHDVDGGEEAASNYWEHLRVQLALVGCCLRLRVF